MTELLLAGDAVTELLLAGDAVTELLLAGALQRRAIGKLLLVGAQWRRAIGKTLLAGMPLGAASGRRCQPRQRAIVKQLRARALASGRWGVAGEQESTCCRGGIRQTGKYLLLRWNQGAVVAQAAGVAPV